MEPRPSLHTKLNIKIVGAGIAGFAAAIALRQAGHNIEILEKSNFVHEYGAGIGLGPNAVKILRGFGFEPEKDARANKWLQSSIIKAETMEIIRKEWIECEERLGAPMVVAHRVDLHRALGNHAKCENGPGQPAILRNGVTVVKYEPESGRIHLEGGSVEQADLIIAADGVHSHAASVVNGCDCPAKLSGTTQIRFMISTQDILNDPIAAPLLSDGPSDASFYVSPGRPGYLVRYPCRQSTMHNFGLYIDEDATTVNDRKHWRAQANRELLRQKMHGFSPVLLRLVDLAPEISLWRLPMRKPTKKCQRGKMIVIGDAAHPVLPHRGQGAVQSIEDAAALGVLFGPDAETQVKASSVEQKLRFFEHVRQKRVSVIQVISEVPLFQDTMAAKKDECLQYLSESELPVDNQSVREWLFAHDCQQALLDSLEANPGCMERFSSQL